LEQFVVVKLGEITQERIETLSAKLLNQLAPQGAAVFQDAGKILG
jgi:hypothetical protein